MKRYLSLLLIVALLPMCLAVPAMADEVDSSLFNLLDYGFCVSDFTNRWVDLEPGKRYFYGPLGLYDELTYEYMDIIFYTDCEFTNLEFSRTIPNVVDLGDGFYRVSGIHGQNQPYFSMNIVSGTFLEIAAWFVSPDSVSAETTAVSGYGTAYGQTNKNISVSFPSGTTHSSWDYTGSEDYYYMDLNGQFTVQFSFPNWKAYDVLDLQLGFICEDINSVAGFFGNEVLDIEVVPFDNSTWNGQYLIFVTIDTSSLDRTSSNNPSIIISGTGDIECTNSVVIRYASGKTLIPNPSLWSHWFSSLNRWLTSGFKSVTDAINHWGQQIVDVINPDVDSGVMNDQLQDTLGQLGNVGAAMDGIARPDFNQIDFDMISRVPSSGLAFMSRLVNIVYNNEVVGPLMLIFLTMGLASFVIFGRR